MTEKRYENIGLHIIDGYIRRSDGVHLYVPPEIVTELNNLSEENEQLKGEVKRLKCINKQLEGRLDGDIALNMDCVEAIEDWENECKRCYGSK